MKAAASVKGFLQFAAEKRELSKDTTVSMYSSIK